MSTTTVSVDPHELEHAIATLRATARGLDRDALQLQAGLPAMSPALDMEIHSELRSIRASMEHLALRLVMDAAFQQAHLAEFALADAVREVVQPAAAAGHTASIIAGGVAELPAAVLHDLGEGQQNFQANFEHLAIAALKPWARRDYFTAGIGFGPIMGGQATLSYSRSGHVFFSPGINVGTPGVSGFVGAGLVNTPRRATAKEVDGFLEGTVYSAGGFLGVGGTGTWSPTAGTRGLTGYETGLGSPQAQLGAAEGFQVPTIQPRTFQVSWIKGPSW